MSKSTPPRSRRQEFVQLNGGFITECTIIGDAANPTLLFVIGSSGIGAFYHRLAAGMSSHFRCIYYDKRGFISKKAPNANEIATKTKNPHIPVRQHADDAAELIKHFSPSKPVFVFGTSTGATAVLDLSLQYPHLVHTAVLHEPITFSVVDTQIGQDLVDFYKYILTFKDPIQSQGIFADFMYSIPDHSSLSQTRPWECTGTPSVTPAPDRVPTALEKYNQGQGQKEAQAMVEYTVNRAKLQKIADKLVIVCGMESCEQRIAVPSAKLAGSLGTNRRRWQLAGNHVSFAGQSQASVFCEQLLFVLHQEDRISLKPERMARM